MSLSPLERGAWGKLIERFTPKPPSPYLNDPALWVEERLGEHLWSKQREVAQSVVTHAKTAVKSCHNAGKSRIASRVAAWFIDTYGDDDGFIVSTAPTYPQVHGILWEEIRGAARQAAAKGNPLPGRVLGSDQWKLDNGKLAGWGRKPADADLHGFQGVHHRHMLVIVDEACGIPRQLWTAIEAITTGDDVHILAIGNPDDPNTEFGDICKPGSGWNVITISAFDTPNLAGEDIPDDLRPLMLSPDWVEDKRRRWGVESPRYVSKVLGQFPDLGTDTLISPPLIEAAQKRSMEPTGRRILGVDVARYGMDRTVIYLRHGPVVRLHGEYAKQATTETTGRVIAAKRETGADEVRVDGVGVGGGVVDQLTEQGHGVLDMQAGGKAQDPERFANARAEWAWLTREALERGELDLDEHDDELAAQLGSFKYRYNSRGQIVIESKDDARKRGLPSPDRADAAILTIVAPAGADLFPKLNWRFFTPVDVGISGQVQLGDRAVTLTEGWTYATAWLPAGEDATNEWAVCAVWTQMFDGNLLLRDLLRARLGDTSPADLIRPLAGRHCVDTTFVHRKHLSDTVRAECARAGVAVTELAVDGDAYARVLPASARQVAGRIWLPVGPSWVSAFTAECQAFPHGRHAGAVEALAAAVRVETTRWVPPARRQTRDDFDPFAALGNDHVDLMSVPL